jgi:hypothetical protein
MAAEPQSPPRPSPIFHQGGGHDTQRPFETLSDYDDAKRNLVVCAVFGNDSCMAALVTGAASSLGGMTFLMGGRLLLLLGSLRLVGAHGTAVRTMDPKLHETPALGKHRPSRPSCLKHPMDPKVMERLQWESIGHHACADWSNHMDPQAA